MSDETLREALQAIVDLGVYYPSTTGERKAREIAEVAEVALAAPAPAPAVGVAALDVKTLARAYLTVVNSLRFNGSTDAEAFWKAVAEEYGRG